MARQVPHIVLSVILLVILARCAQIGELTGGKHDTTPPKLVQAIPADKSTNFNSEEIVLKFDEYVQVKDLTNQLVVSPRLKTTPEINAVGKTVVITLVKEELLPNTTYRFYFGNAIADMNESNSITDFEYVFSTGPAIDSLKIKGTVTDAFNNKAVGKVLVGLYNNATSNDSTPYNEAPDYTARTNENGQFNFSNLPYHTFKVVAFTDNNKNSLYDGESEKVGFLDSALSLRSDSATVNLKVFQEESLKGFIKKTSMPYYGFGMILLNKKARVSARPLKDSLAPFISETKPGVEKDTLAFFYKGLKDTLGMVVTNFTYKKTDTIRLNIPRDNSSKRRLKKVNSNAASGILALGVKLSFSFLNWMDTTRADLSKIKLSMQEDSTHTAIPLSGRWTSINSYELNNSLKEGISYSLKMDTLAFFDVSGFKNDSLKFSFKPQSKADFGKVSLKLLLNKKQNYIVQLLNNNGQVVQQQSISFSLSSSNAKTLDFIDVPPGTYTAKIIFDDNNNKKWDSGNLLSGRQPERVIVNSKQLKVLSDWEIEEEITVKE